MTPTHDMTLNPGMCLDWELNQRPFGLQAGIQSTEPHQPRPLWFNLVSLFWDCGSKECVVQALCGSEDQSTGVVCNSRLHCPLAMVNSEVQLPPK